MNYLAHYMLAERDHGHAATAAASLLPDLLGYAGATRPTHRVPTDDCCDSPIWSAVQSGMRHHIEVDRVFHGCDWFEQRMRDTGQWLRDHDSPLREHWSMWMLRHVAIELVIDHALLADDDTLPERIYAGLRELQDEPPAVAALDDRFACRGGLEEYLGGFLGKPWLHHYAEPAVIGRALDRIFGRLLERKPRIRDLYQVTSTFTADETAALPPFVDAVIENVRANGLPEIRVPAALPVADEKS